VSVGIPKELSDQSERQRARPVASSPRYNSLMQDNADNNSDEPNFAPLCSIFRRFIKRQGLKFTPERAKILNAVLGKTAVFEADELLFEMRKSGDRVSKATIYRTLKHLIEAGIITEVLLDNKQAHYQLSYGRKPQGHLVCIETRKVIEFSLPELDQLRDRICKERGYLPVSCRVVIYGVSPQTQRVAAVTEPGVV